MTTDPKQYCTGCSVRDEHVDAITEQPAEKDSRIAELEEAIETGHAIIDVMRQSVSIMPEHRKQLALVLGLPETATVPEMIVRGGRLADAERRTAAMIKAIADTHNEMQRVSADVENMLGDRMQSVIMQLRSALKASPRPAGSVDVIGRPLPVAPEAVTKSTAKRLAVQRDEPDPILRHCIPLQPARADRERLKTAQDLPTPPEITDEVRAQILAEAKEWRASVRAPHPPDPPESERAEPIARQSGALDAFSIVSQDRDTWKQRALAAESEVARLRGELRVAIEDCDFGLTAAHTERDQLRAELASVTADLRAARDGWEHAAGSLREADSDLRLLRMHNVVTLEDELLTDDGKTAGARLRAAIELRVELQTKCENMKQQLSACQNSWSPICEALERKKAECDQLRAELSKTRAVVEAAKALMASWRKDDGRVGMFRERLFDTLDVLDRDGGTQ
jgi:hypothetical protein